VGACHNAGRLVDAINANSSTQIPPEQKQLYRLAALLHDIGHYPFSHATEHAIREFYAGESLLNSQPEVSRKTEKFRKGLDHENVGRVILEHDPSIRQVLKYHNIDIEALQKIFSKSDPDAFVGIISSDLDCDRLDYLRRTARSGGVPYGEVDADFIISKASVDEDGILCFETKSATAIDHFLVSRFYDWMQVVYHKTVVGLEWSLQIGITELLKEETVDFSEDAVTALIVDNRWAAYDDSFMLSHFKRLYEKVKEASGGEVMEDHLEAIMYRRPAKEVFIWQSILEPKDNKPALLRRLIEAEIRSICHKKGIDARRFCVITQKPFQFSTNSLPEGDYGERAGAVNIVGRNEKKSTLLVDRPDTLVHQMKNKRHCCVRVMYLPRRLEKKSVREQIRSDLAAAAK
jgi:hypothetical protein